MSIKKRTAHGDHKQYQRRVIETGVTFTSPAGDFHFPRGLPPRLTQRCAQDEVRVVRSTVLSSGRTADLVAWSDGTCATFFNFHAQPPNAVYASYLVARRSLEIDLGIKGAQ